MKSQGHETFTVDYIKSFNPDLVCDLTKELPQILKDKIKQADIVWMSPPCTTFSMASGNTHWTIDRQPKTDNAITGKQLIDFCNNLSGYCDYLGKIYFIENPVARARWFMPDDERRHTVWYCQYGDSRAKPTDIWTNLKEWKHKNCKNGNKNCHHERAPRGSKTGTQGLKGAKERGVIPELLFKEILEVYNKNIGEQK